MLEDTNSLDMPQADFAALTPLNSVSNFSWSLNFDISISLSLEKPQSRIVLGHKIGIFQLKGFKIFDTF